MIEDPNIQPGSFAPSAVERAQLRLIAQLTRERDALAAECGEWRSYNFGSGDITKVDAAIEATNALPGMRERLEGQG